MSPSTYEQWSNRVAAQKELTIGGINVTLDDTMDDGVIEGIYFDQY